MLEGLAYSVYNSQHRMACRFSAMPSQHIISGHFICNIFAPASISWVKVLWISILNLLRSFSSFDFWHRSRVVQDFWTQWCNFPTSLSVVTFETCQLVAAGRWLYVDGWSWAPHYWRSYASILPILWHARECSCYHAFLPEVRGISLLVFLHALYRLFHFPVLILRGRWGASFVPLVA